jgi:GDPmannose 4,6-dehydratase
VPRALITGITGQDGSYLAEQLLADGWEVHGLVRRSSTSHTAPIRSVPDVHLHGGDLCDFPSLLRVVQEVRPDHIYNFAAQSSVAESFRQPLHTADVVALGAGRLLEAMRIAAPKARFYQASSSEMYGGTVPGFHPRSPYAAAKVHAHHLAAFYRESYGLFVVAGILFNHESPRRGVDFVTRRIARGVAAIARGEARELRLGNLDARRDWGWAPDYVAAAHRMLLQERPVDHVIATGESHSVRDFAHRAFAVAGLDAAEFVRTDPALLRPADVGELVGDASVARDVLGWAPTVPFDEIVRRMVEAELAA